MKYIKITFYIAMFFVFFYLIFNLNYSINSLSFVLVNFFKNLFPYLLMFLIINQILIKTNLISLLGYLLQFIFYPLFKLNAKSCSLALISIINGFPSSVLYSNIMVKNKTIDKETTHKIALCFFLPSFTFIFFLIKNSLPNPYFNIFIISLYLPTFIMLLINRNKNPNQYLKLSEIKKEIKISFNEFNYLKDLKEIFINSFITLINILGMISLYSILTLLVPYSLIKGLFEFSIPSLNILNSSLPILIKTLFLLIILSFSSFSSISQASIYLEDLNLNLKTFILYRLLFMTISLYIFSLLIITII